MRIILPPFVEEVFLFDFPSGFVEKTKEGSIKLLFAFLAIMEDV
jgi:hypothetical protein